MNPVITKTFGGLSRQYYFRQFVFGLIFPAIVVFMANSGSAPAPYSLIFIALINTFLYPYARFVYEGIMGFIMGENVFFVNALLMLFTKLATMLLCWGFAIFIAPVGLAYLYYHHSKSN